MYKYILRKNTVVRGDYDGVWLFPDLVGIDVVVVGLRQYFGYGDRLCEGHDPNHHGILQVTRDHQGQIRRGERGKAVLGEKKQIPMQNTVNKFKFAFRQREFTHVVCDYL